MSSLLDFYQHLPLHINPIAFSVGSFSIYWYSLMYIIGFAVVYWLLNLRIKKGEGDYKKSDILDFLLIAFAGLIIGARLGYVLFYDLGYFIHHPLEAFLPFQFTDYLPTGQAGGLLITGYYGLSYHGGLIGVLAAGYIFCRRKLYPVKSANGGSALREFNRVNFWRLADFVVPAVPAGYFFGRIGNFLNGELYGRATNVSWGMYFPADSSRFLRHPSQLYEAFFEGLVLFAILWFIKDKLIVKGQLLNVYLFIYGFFRFSIEFFREPDKQIGYILGFLTLGQIFSLILILISLIIYKYRK